MFIEILGTLLMVCAVVYLNIGNTEVKPKIEYWYYSYTYLNQWSDKYVMKSSVFVGNFIDLVQYLNAVQPNSSIFYRVAITKAEFEALK